MNKKSSVHTSLLLKQYIADDTIGFMNHGAQTVVVVGGGATGTGIAREASERGYKVILIERGELGSGTSGRFHGILHSGARYAVNDPVVAADCYRENQHLRQIIPSAITDTGGMFIALNDKEALHSKTLMRACETAGIPIEEVSPKEALRLEPQLAPHITAAFLVPDGFIDGAELMRLNKEAAMSAPYPARFLTGHAVVNFQIHANRINAVSVQNIASGAIEHILCDQVINAAGVWAGRVAKLASADIQMIFDKGSMIVFKDQFSSRVINRCRPENDGDLLVPHAGHSIIGTTARITADPDDNVPTQEEVDVLLDEGAAMIPSMRTAEAVRIYAGVRPLINDHATSGSSRSISRSFQVIDHSSEGIINFISVVGGKVTLFRQMAEAAIDALALKK